MLLCNGNFFIIVIGLDFSSWMDAMVFLCVIELKLEIFSLQVCFILYSDIYYLAFTRQK